MDGDDVFTLMIGFIGLWVFTFSFTNVNISAESISYAMKVCTDNEGLRMITEDKGAEGIVTCTNGAVFEYSSTDIRKGVK